MRLLVDGDIVAYRNACVAGDEVDVMRKIDNVLVSMLSKYETHDYKIFLSGKKKPNFRRVINPQYKAHRDKLEKPYWLPFCLDYLEGAWEAEYVHGYEADDALGWYQNSNSVICTIDKDLDMIPGHHYNFVKDTQYEIQAGEALQFFYKQMLIGDTSDNIFGIKGLGPAKSAKLIDILETEQEMFDVVYNKYNNPERFVNNACCLWIQQQKGITWAHRSQHLTLPKECQQEVDLILDYMISSQADI